MSRRITAVFLGSLIFSASLFAQSATFVDNVLVIPKATIGETAYSLELGLVINDNNYDFSVLAAAEIPFTNTDGASIFSEQVLRVPRVEVGSTNYSLNLALISADPILFRLSSFAEVISDPIASSLEQATTLYTNSLETQVVQTLCIVCHVQGGAAANADLLFERASETSKATNLSAFRNYLNGSAAKRTQILSKVTGVSHDGGAQLAEGSASYTNLAAFLQHLVDHGATN